MRYVLLSALGLLACTQTDEPGAFSAESDGVALVSAIPSPPLFTVRGEALWDLHGEDAGLTGESGEYGGVIGVVSLPGDRYLVSGANQLRVFSADGAELWRFGRKGAGPDEFNGLGWPCRVSGDTIAVQDQQNGRIALIELHVGVVAVIPGHHKALRAAGCSGQGHLVLLDTRRSGQADGARWSVELWNARGMREAQLATVRAYQPEVVGEGPVAVGFVDTLIFVADGTFGDIQLFTRHGVQVATLTVRDAREPITEEEIPERYGVRPAGLSPSQRQQWWATVRARPRRKSWPAFVEVRSDQRGRLWVLRSYAGPEQGDAWTLIDIAGKAQGTVVVPPRWSGGQATLVSVVDDALAMRYEDSTGWSRIAVLRVDSQISAGP